MYLWNSRTLQFYVKQMLAKVYAYILEQTTD